MSRRARRAWTALDDHFLVTEAAGRSAAWAAAWLDRDVRVVRKHAARLGVRLSNRRRESGYAHWSEAELAVVRDRYVRDGAAAIAADLGRTLSQVYQAAKRLGVRRKAPRGSVWAKIEAALPRLHAAGYGDPDVAAALGVDRRHVCEVRRPLGLPAIGWGRRARAKQAANQKRTLEKHGVSTLAEIRYRTHRRYAKAAGWPADLRPRSVTVLTALYERGPMTLRELAKLPGVAWANQRNPLASNDAEGSVTAHLVARGLILRFRKFERCPESGTLKDVYMPALDLERRPPDPDLPLPEKAPG